MAEIEQIADEEAGSSVRTKLNAAIDRSNYQLLGTWQLFADDESCVSAEYWWFKATVAMQIIDIAVSIKTAGAGTSSWQLLVAGAGQGSFNEDTLSTEDVAVAVDDEVGIECVETGAGASGAAALGGTVQIFGYITPPS